MAVYNYSLADGREVQVSLSMAAIYNLQREDPKLYQRYKAIFSKIGSGEVDELVMAETIYIGYRAANPGADITYEDFLEEMSDSREELAKTFSKLYGMEEKKQGSVQPSGRRHGKNRGVR